MVYYRIHNSPPTVRIRSPHLAILCLLDTLGLSLLHKQKGIDNDVSDRFTEVFITTGGMKK
jgi:hypothetical protein